jgi:hypothetical protein
MDGIETSKLNQPVSLQHFYEALLVYVDDFAGRTKTLKKVFFDRANARFLTRACIKKTPIGFYYGGVVVSLQHARDIYYEIYKRCLLTKESTARLLTIITKMIYFEKVVYVRYPLVTYLTATNSVTDVIRKCFECDDVPFGAEVCLMKLLMELCSLA